jgi:hypothetical protein
LLEPHHVLSDFYEASCIIFARRAELTVVTPQEHIQKKKISYETRILYGGEAKAHLDCWERRLGATNPRMQLHQEIIFARRRRCLESSLLASRPSLDPSKDPIIPT